MRLAIRLFRPAANQNVNAPKLWQDPVLGYFETHGKTEFIAGEQYNLSDEEKKAVLWRNRIKQILKKEYLRREFDPHTFKYKEGVVIDPAMFRWYAADMTQAEYFRLTPRSILLYAGLTYFLFYLYIRIVHTYSEKRSLESLDGKLLWWDRQSGRELNICGHGQFSPTSGSTY